MGLQVQSLQMRKDMQKVWCRLLQDSQVRLHEDLQGQIKVLLQEVKHRPTRIILVKT